jgi:N-acetylglutamate synthase-like GNAT family acetyltransferase
VADPVCGLHDKALPLAFAVTEVDEQSYFDLRGFEIVQHLRFVPDMQFSLGFEFDQHFAFHNQISQK